MAKFARFISEEFDTLLLLICAAALVAMTTFNFSLENRIPVGFALLLTLGLRTFRIKYQIDDIRSQARDEALRINSELVALRIALEKDGLHEAAICDRPGFYTAMVTALERCERTVDLTQLDSHQPSHYGTMEMDRYFTQLRKIVAERKYITFRRIIALPTLQKLEWLLDTIESVRSLNNFQIRIVDLAGAARIPIPLSLQIFDSKELCLVDPSSSYMTPHPQNSMLWVRSAAVASVFQIYYNDLWALSSKAKDGGVVFWNQLSTELERLRGEFPDESLTSDKLALRIAKMSGKRR